MILKDADNRVNDLRTLKKLRLNYGFQHRTRIDNEIRNIHTGVEGERSVAHYLARDFAHEDDIAVLHDLRIAYQSDYAQTDHLVIDRITGVVWVLETKNYNGILVCNPHGDWTVEYTRSTLPIESPVSQARRHCTTLLLWMRLHSIPLTDVRPVVLVGPKTALNRQGYTDSVPLMKSDNFPKWLKDQRQATSNEGRQPALSVDDLKHLGKLISDAHEPKRETDWLRALGLPRNPPVRQPKQPRSQPSKSLSDNVGASTDGAVLGIAVIASLIVFGGYKLLTVPHVSKSPTPAVSVKAVASRYVTDPPGIKTAVEPTNQALTQFPPSGTVEWGPNGRPISGQLARLDIWDVTQSPQRKIVRIRNAMVLKINGRNVTPPIATIYMDAGARVTVTVRPGLYDVVATSGGAWNPATRRFNSQSTTVSFSTVMPMPDLPGVIAMGAPDQTADVISEDRF